MKEMAKCGNILKTCSRHQSQPIIKTNNQRIAVIQTAVSNNTAIRVLKEGVIELDGEISR